MKPLTLLIADDHPLFREGLKNIISRDERYNTIYEAGTGKEALKIIETRKPDIAILDINMPEPSGLQVAETLRDRNTLTRVVILTMYDTKDLFDRAMDLGVMGYVLKDCASTDILECIKSVEEGEPYISPTLMKYLIKKAGQRKTQEKEVQGITLLTESERHVLRLIAEGKTTKVIAYELFISPKTVENHRSNICTKLNVHGTNALFRFALEHKLIL